MTFFCFTVAVLILLFSFFAEVTFWQEFESRFNFIAVDYLVYTYEVINNINESYPLPLLITAMLLMTSLVFLLFYKRHYFTDNFEGSTPFIQRFTIFLGLLFISVFYTFFIDNSLAEAVRTGIGMSCQNQESILFFQLIKITRSIMSTSTHSSIIERRLIL